MPRVKRGRVRATKRKRILSRTKGYKWTRKTRIRLAKPAILKAGVKAYADRKRKKRDMRGLWNIRINAAVRQRGGTYSQFMHALKEANIAIDRKNLAKLAATRPNLFDRIFEATTHKKAI